MQNKFHSKEKKAFTREEIADVVSEVGAEMLANMAYQIDSDNAEEFKKLDAMTLFLGLVTAQALVKLFDEEEEV